MNEFDREIEKSEEEARRHHSQPETRPAEPERRASVASSASSSSVSSSESGMSRIATARDNEVTDAERVQTMLSRTRTAQSVFTHTVGASARTVSRRKLPGFGPNNKPYPPLLGDQEQYVVEYTGFDDPMHPQNMPIRRKYVISVLLAFTSSFSTFGSSVFSPAVLHVAAEFHVSRVVATLAISFYILGFAFGPIMWAPLSELYGRRYPILVSVFGFALFQFAVATAKDLQTVMLCRFFGGIFASAPLSLVGAAYADIWDNARRGYAITIFSLTVSVPALLAPVIGGFLVISKAGWRWTEYITGICASIMFVLNLIFLEETYAPVVLVNKARLLRRTTKNWAIFSRQEAIEIDFKELVERNFSRPLKILFTEPIVFWVSLYVAFIYGMLYLMLSAFPIVFALGYKMKGGVANLPFISLCVGQILGSIVVMLWEPTYIKRMKANRGIPIPENRLPPAMLGAILFPIGLFWFAWAGNYPEKVHWIVPTLSGLFIGAGIILIFLQCLNYIIDSYLMFAASAISANSFLRSIFGAAFPLFAVQLFNGLGVNWAGSLLAFVSLALVPMPFVFYFKGAQIRRRSKLAPTMSFDDDE